MQKRAKYEIVSGPRGSIRTWCPSCGHGFGLFVKGVRRKPYFRNLEDLEAHKESFWEHVQKGNGSDACWLWKRGVNTSGYGQVAFNYPRKTMLAHRVCYMLFVGQIPEKLVVMHGCHTPLCVRPGHLRVGTQRENVLQRYERERARKSGTGNQG